MGGACGGVGGACGEGAWPARRSAGGTCASPGPAPASRAAGGFRWRRLLCPAALLPWQQRARRGLHGAGPGLASLPLPPPFLSLSLCPSSPRVAPAPVSGVLHPCVAAADCHVAVQLAVVLPQAPRVFVQCLPPVGLGGGGFGGTNCVRMVGATSAQCKAPLDNREPHQDRAKHIRAMQTTPGPYEPHKDNANHIRTMFDVSITRKIRLQV